MTQKNKGSALGISLILVVFILLCLITFGTLSYLQAKANNALSLSSTENTLAYYKADIAAKETLQQIDTMLALNYNEESFYWYTLTLQAAFTDLQDTQVLSAAYEPEGDAVAFSYTTPVSDTEVLRTTIELIYPATDVYYKIVGWQLEFIGGE